MSKPVRNILLENIEHGQKRINININPCFEFIYYNFFDKAFFLPSDIDECAKKTDDCDKANGVCRDTQGSFDCSCKPGYQ